MEEFIESTIARVRSAQAGGATLAIRGGGSKAFYGGVTTGEWLEMRPYSGIIDYEPKELVLTVRAGTALADARSVLRGLLHHLNSLIELGLWSGSAAAVFAGSAGVVAGTAAAAGAIAGAEGGGAVATGAAAGALGRASIIKGGASGSRLQAPDESASVAAPSIASRRADRVMGPLMPTAWSACRRRGWARLRRASAP